MKKLQFGCCIRWIGWELDFGMGCVSIPEDKLLRLHTVISSALKGKYTDRATLSKLCGMLQWLFKLFPLAKPWLRSLYLDLNTPRATNFSVRQHEWQAFVSCLNDNLHLTSLPNGAAITLGSKVLAVRHRKVKTKRDSDFAFANLPLKSEAHRDISCYECLGQILYWCGF